MKSNRDPHHISWKNHNIDVYIQQALQDYVMKKKLTCNYCGSIEFDFSNKNKECIWCGKGNMTDGNND